MKIHTPSSFRQMLAIVPFMYDRYLYVRMYLNNRVIVLEMSPFFARNPKIGRTRKQEQTERDLPFILIAAFPSSSSQRPVEAGAEDEFRGQRGHKYRPVVDNDRAVLEMSPMDPSSSSSSSSSLPVHQASLNLSQSSLVPAASPVRDSPAQQTHLHIIRNTRKLKPKLQHGIIVVSSLTCLCLIFFLLLFIFKLQ
ncbi:unnamed protein product [Malus baccata var. baccata]